MPISITNAIASPNVIPDNNVTTITITFDGVALKDEVDVIVEFRIAPFPELSFSGNRVSTGSFKFNSQSDTFSKTLQIRNTTPASVSWINALVGLTAKEYVSGYEDVTSAAIVYR